MVKVSIIVPVYNAEKTLVRCLESIVGQTYLDREIILVNDGSTDNSQAICEEFGRKWQEICLITQKNAGPASARNTGIDNATGKYIAFIDADDYAETTMIEAMVHVAEANRAEMVICGYYQELSGNVCEHKFAYDPGLYEGEHARKIGIDLISDVSDTRIPPYSWVRMVLRSVLEHPKMRYPAGMVRSEDYYFYVQLHFRINRLYLLTDQPLYHYMEVNESITHRYVKEYWKSVKEIYLGLKEKLPEQSDIRARLDIMLIQRSLIALNNSSRYRDKKVFKYEVNEIMKDPILNSVFEKISIKAGMKQYGMYYIFMKKQIYFCVYGRYLIKFYKNRRA